MSSQKLKILLSVFACHPAKGSEEGIGWNWLKELSKEYEVYALISCILDQEKFVRAAVDELPHRENIYLTFIPMPRRSNSIVAVFPPLEFYDVCLQWQQQALVEAEKILEKVSIDIVHHATYGSWTIPSYLWKLNKPFILGPVTGSQRIPLVGYSFLPFKGIIQELVRMAYFFWVRMISEDAKESVRKANLVLCGNLETLNEIRTIRDFNTNLLMSDTGIPFLPNVLGERQALGHTTSDAPSISLLWAGLIEPRKNFGLLLQALKVLPTDLDWKLIVAGDGPLLPFWKQKVAKLGLQAKIEFLGQVHYQQMHEYYQKSDIFVFPSLREGSPTVILEAMAHKLAVIGLKLNGTATVLSDDCGVLINVGSRKNMVHDFATAIVTLSSDQDLCRKIAEKGYEKVCSFYTWEERRKTMSSLYQRILSSSSGLN